MTDPFWLPPQPPDLPEYDLEPDDCTHRRIRQIGPDDFDCPDCGKELE